MFGALDVHKWQEVSGTNLQREDYHCEAHNRCDAYCHHHRFSVVEAGDHSHHVGHAEGQDRLKIKAAQIDHQHCSTSLSRGKFMTQVRNG